ncbi:hypothetical protein RclHR1_02860011 [Rhizophagus clarus]|uniref:Uncharacterized protein n=1 Tax=Rhizophagus clarus TaxID=94130 RepID=A0A2Z6RYB4_9GLOM|nr:hypothetical protein RclHR1_02860011 [Rhizophagus clarus]
MKANVHFISPEHQIKVQNVEMPVPNLISKVQNIRSASSVLHFEGLEHRCLFDFLFWIKPPVLKAYNIEVLELHFEVVQIPEKVWTLFEVWKLAVFFEDTGSCWFPDSKHYLNEISKIQDYSISKLDSNYSKGPTCSFRRLSSILKTRGFWCPQISGSEILKVHSFPSAF